MQTSIIDAHPDMDIWVGIVWIKMNSNDTLEAAQKAMEQFIDPRVEQFYDPVQESGRLVAKDLPLNAPVAWDIYLFYKDDTLWTAGPPSPMHWMHQLSDTDPESRYLRQGQDLVKGLARSMDEIIQG